MRIRHYASCCTTSRWVPWIFFVCILLLSCDAFGIHDHPLLLQHPKMNRSHLLLSMSNGRTKGMDYVVVVQTGFGCCHGRNPTKAAVRACQNAIDTNSVKIKTIIPGGYDAMKIHIQLGVPEGIGEVNVGAIQAEFPYGTVLPIEVQQGGMLASNGIWQAGMAEPKDDMTLAVVCVTIGYDEPQ